MTDKTNLAMNADSIKINTRRKYLTQGLALAASPLLAACGAGSEEPLDNAGLVSKSENQDTLLSKDNFLKLETNASADKSPMSSADAKSSFITIVPAGAYRVEVVFASWHGMKVHMTDRRNSAKELMGEKGNTLLLDSSSDTSHKAHFSFYRIANGGEDLADLRIEVSTPVITGPGSKPPRVDTTENSDSWKRIKHDDWHNGMEEYEWRYTDLSSGKIICYVRFHKLDLKKIRIPIPYGLTPITNRVGHHNLSGERAEEPRHLEYLTSTDGRPAQDPKTVVLKVITDKNDPRTDTVVVPNRRKPGHSQLVATLESAQTPLETAYYKEMYTAHVVTHAKDKRKASKDALTPENDPHDYLHLKKMMMTAIGGNTLFEAVAEGEKAVRKYADTAFDSAVKRLWEYSDKCVPDKTEADVVARKLYERARKMPVAKDSNVSYTGSASLQVQLAATWKIGIHRGYGGRAVWQLANRTGYSGPAGAGGGINDYVLGKDLGYLLTLHFILKGPEFKYEGILNKISTDLHFSVTLRISGKGARLRVENITVDLKTEFDIADWLADTFNQATAWFKSATSSKPSDDDTLPFGTVKLDPIPEWDGPDILKIIDRFEDETMGRDDPLAQPFDSPTTLEDSIREIVDRQRRRIITRKMRNWNYFEGSVLKFIIPNGEVATDPENTGVPFMGAFKFVGATWSPGVRAQGGGGYEYSISVKLAKAQVYIRALLSGDVSFHVSAKEEVFKAMKLDCSL